MPSLLLPNAAPKHPILLDTFFCHPLPCAEAPRGHKRRGGAFSSVEIYNNAAFRPKASRVISLAIKERLITNEISRRTNR
jgi:hypothetical protein